MDMRIIPKPDPATTTISTISLLLLKYCPTIRVDASRVSPTPTPKKCTHKIDHNMPMQNFFLSDRRLAINSTISYIKLDTQIDKKHIR